MTAHRRLSGNPTHILLVRHADVHNPDNVLYGRLPRFRLSEKGQGEAEQVARFLSDVRLGAIYSSPQLRARQTAARIALEHPEVKPRRTRLINEVLTSWQGTPERDLPRGLNYYTTPKNPDDETLDAIYDRFSQFVRRTVRRYQGQTVLAVSHGDPIKIVTMGLLGADLHAPTFRRFDIPGKASVTVLRFAAPGSEPSVLYFDSARQARDARLRLESLDW